MSDATISLVVLGASVALFIWNRLPVGVVAVLTALALAATGVITQRQAIAGFGDPVVLFIATLFVLSEGLQASGVTAWVGRLLVTRVGTGHGRVVVSLMVLSALLAALVTPNGAAAAALPVMLLLARHARMSTSRLGIPLAYAASAGALLTLSGSPVNVIVADALDEAAGHRFGFFEFAAIGAPLLLVTVIVTVLFGDRLLPNRGLLPAGDEPEPVGTAVRLSAAGKRAVVVLVATIALLASGVAEPAVAGLVGAVAMVLTGATSVPRALRSVPWETLVLIAGLVPLSVAIAESGAADELGHLIVGIVPEGNGHLLLVALFVLTAVLGQFISNAATVLVVTPIALATAETVAIAPEPVLMLVAAAGAASFLTPIATPANMIVKEPSRYRFGDYWRLGLVLTITWLLVAVSLVPLVWPLTPGGA